MLRLALLFVFAAMVLAGLLAAPASAAPIPKHLMKKAEGDKEKLQGKWKLESIQLGDTPKAGVELTLEIAGDFLRLRELNTDAIATLKLDTVKGVKRFSIKVIKLENGKPFMTELSLGYILDGDKLTFALNLGMLGTDTVDDPARPFETTYLLVFTRMKRN